MVVLITRDVAGGELLQTYLLQHEINCLLDPLVEIVPLGQDADIELACDKADAIIFTSRNAVKRVAATNARRDVKIYAVGEATATIAEKAGYLQVSDCAAATGLDGAAAILDFIKSAGQQNENMIYFSGAEVAADMAAILSEKGHKVSRFICYAQRGIDKFSSETIARWDDITDVPLLSVASAERFIKAAGGMDISKIRAWVFSDKIASIIDGAGFGKIFILPRADVGTLLEAMTGYKNS